MSNGVLASAVISEVTGCDMEFEVYGRGGRLRLACLRYDGTEAYDRSAVPGGMQTSLRRLAGSIMQLPRGAGLAMLYLRRMGHFVSAIVLERSATSAGGRHAVRRASRRSVHTPRLLMRRVRGDRR
jgi:hypothetical protein